MNHRIFEITSKLKSILNHIQARDVKKMTIKLETSQSDAKNAAKPEAGKSEKIVYSSFAACSMIGPETEPQTERNAHITSERNAQNSTARNLETEPQMKRNADTAWERNADTAPKRNAPK
jgi:hypothetical protein